MEAANRLPLIPRAFVAADRRRVTRPVGSGRVTTRRSNNPCRVYLRSSRSRQVRTRGVLRGVPPSRAATLAGWRAPATLRPSEGAAKNLEPATYLFRSATFGRRTPGDEVCGLGGSSKRAT